MLARTNGVDEPSGACPFLDLCGVRSSALRGYALVRSRFREPLMPPTGCGAWRRRLPTRSAKIVLHVGHVRKFCFQHGWPRGCLQRLTPTHVDRDVHEVNLLVAAMCGSALAGCFLCDSFLSSIRLLRGQWCSHGEGRCTTGPTNTPAQSRGVQIGVFHNANVAWLQSTWNCAGVGPRSLRRGRSPRLSTETMQIT